MFDNYLDTNMASMSNNVVIKYKNGHGYVYSKVSQQHLFLSEEVSRYLIEAIDNAYNVKKFLNCFKDLEDRIYIENIIKLLNDMDVFKGSLDVNKNKIGISLTLMLTEKCNLECKHCCANCSPSAKTKLSLKDWKEVINVLSKLNPQNIVFSGGEPLILNYFSQVVEYIRCKCKDTNLILSTNGTLLKEYPINFIKNNFSKVDISLDGFDNISVKKVRGEGVFNPVISNIKYLQENGFNNINISAVLGDKYDFTEEFIVLSKKLGVNYIIRDFKSAGRGKENSKYFLSEDTSLSLGQFEIFNKELKDDQSDNVIISSFNCDAGINQLYIKDNGDIYPCPSLINSNYRIGNYKDSNILDRINNVVNPIISFKGLLKDTICEKCDMLCFCWCCIADFERAKESDELEKWCDLSKKYLDKIIWRNEDIYK